MEVPTCLFTGVPLVTPSEEHAIPRGLGGRIRTSTTVSGEFNNAAGALLDEPLVRAYGWIMNALGPLLSGEHEPTKLRVKGAESGRELRLAPGQESGLPSKVVVLERGPTGRPKRWVGQTIADAERLAKQLGLRSGQYEVADEELVPDDILHGIDPVPSLSPVLEEAALKCILVAWDALLGAESPMRTPALHGARQLIASSVTGDRPGDRSIGEFSLGVSVHDRLRLALDLARRKDVCATSPFEHRLAIWTTASRTIEAVWSILGIDFWTFRLTQDWRGPDFAYIAGCGILLSTNPFGPTPAPELMSLSLLRRTPFTAIAPADREPQVHEVYARGVVAERGLAYQRATDLVERTADDFVWACLLNHMHHHRRLGESANLADGILRRLRILYLNEDGQTCRAEAELEAVADRLSYLRTITIDRAGDATADLRSLWLAEYRECLTWIELRRGAPGLQFVYRMETRKEDAS